MYPFLIAWHHTTRWQIRQQDLRNTYVFTSFKNIVCKTGGEEIVNVLFVVQDEWMCQLSDFKLQFMSVCVTESLPGLEQF